jgi:hypothetical protein
MKMASDILLIMNRTVQLRCRAPDLYSIGGFMEYGSHYAN